MKREAKGKGNQEKYYSYKAAWQQIKYAQEEKFYIEAVAIEESIIADRLASFLCGKNLLSANAMQKSPLANFIALWKKAHRMSLVHFPCLELVDNVDKWKCLRNFVVHSLVKSKPGTPTMSVDAYIKNAEKVAKQGELLAKKVQSWHKKELTFSNRIKKGANI